jgi:hypothetical protein
VPVEHGRWWPVNLDDATLRIVPRAGHLVPLVVWAEILGAVAPRS